MVAAFQPDDLDAMDESVPFTKQTLDNLLGIVHSEESYRHYFDCFQKAQRNRAMLGKSDHLKKNTYWDFREFLDTPIAREIPAVQEFKAKMALL